MLVRISLFLILLFGIVNPTISQEPANQAMEKKKIFAKERFYLGGTFGLQFGTYTNINVSPLIGYKIIDRWSVGTGFTYLYFKDNIYDYSTSIYGGRLFTRYFFLENLFGHVEYELLNFEALFYDGSNYIPRRVTVPSFFVGGGFSQRMGRASLWYILILYNLNDNLYSPYRNPVVRMGVSFGL